MIKSKDIVVISQYLRNIEDMKNNNSRFIYLADMLTKEGHNVEIVTSDFYHATKKHFQQVDELCSITITTIHEPGYKKNVSFARLCSHRQLSKGIGAYLYSRKKPDVIYCAIPSVDVAYEVGKFFKKKKTRFIIDIQDLWPEAFKMVLDIPVVSDVIFLSMKNKANKIYAWADEIIAVSQTYAKRAIKYNKKCKEATIVFLGTEKDKFDRYRTTKPNDDVIRIVYIGSLTRSYDIETVINAIAKLNVNKHVEFIVIGDGPMRNKFEQYAKEKNINYEFTGRLRYPDMIARLSQCDIAVNPIRKGSAGSVINKVGDYAICGLPVVNSQECIEYKELLEKNIAGINCACENAEDISNALRKLIYDNRLREEMANNSAKLGYTFFDRASSYSKIISKVNKGEEY